MKNSVLIFYLLAFWWTTGIAASEIDGLWSVTDLIFDGTTNRLENLYLRSAGDTVEFLNQDQPVAMGQCVNDTIFLHYGFQYYDIEWIRIVNPDSLISSLPNLESSNGLAFSRIDLNGEWLKTEKWWTGEFHYDTCTITQVVDSFYFEGLQIGPAIAYLRRDSLMVAEGFEGLGIDFFTLYNNDYFLKTAPLVEAVDWVSFTRLDTLSGSGIQMGGMYNPDLQIYPVPVENILYIHSASSRILQVKLYTVNGQLLLQEGGGKNTETDLSFLEKGLYVLEVTLEEGRFGRLIIKE